MDVKDGLSGGFSAVQDQAVAGIGELHVTRDRCGTSDDLSDDFVVAAGNFVRRCDVTAGDHQNVGGRLWVDVFERHDIVIAVNLPRRNLIVRNSAEETTGIRHGHLRTARL